VGARPFRAPHHTVSSAGLVGGGPTVRPGEISLAHNGVLFLDELLEFPRHVLEMLRQPLEDRAVTIVRVRRGVTYPADFMLIAALNPCPCGHLGSTVRTCVCSTTAIGAYRSRLSGPLLDRIDLHVDVPRCRTASSPTPTRANPAPRSASAWWRHASASRRAAPAGTPV
jgi:magnesium chelatase family protein